MQAFGLGLGSGPLCQPVSDAILGWYLGFCSIGLIFTVLLSLIIIF